MLLRLTREVHSQQELEQTLNGSITGIVSPFLVLLYRIAVTRIGLSAEIGSSNISTVSLKVR